MNSLTMHRSELEVAFATAFDNLAFGVLLVAPDGRRLFANEAANNMVEGVRSRGEMRRPSVHTGHLAARINDYLRQLRRAPEPVPTPVAVRLPHATDGPPFILRLAPLQLSNEGQSPVYGVMAVIIDPSSVTAADEAYSTPWFGLTRAEWNVARRLSAGQSSEQIAQDGALSPNTVKTHLRRVFRKLGVNRQADLVRTIALAAVVRSKS